MFASGFIPGFTGPGWQVNWRVGDEQTVIPPPLHHLQLSTVLAPFCLMFFRLLACPFTARMLCHTVSLALVYLALSPRQSPLGP